MEFRRDIALSRPEKAYHSIDIRRRNFLIRCCQGLSATLVPIGLRGAQSPSKFPLDSSQAGPCASEFHLDPHYRVEIPLDRMLLKVRAGLDSFHLERYHDQIAAILANWSSKLLESPHAVQAIGSLFTLDFEGFSPRSTESRRVRSGALEIHRRTFASQGRLRGSDFLRELQSDLSVFSNFLTAEFQVTCIQAAPPSASAPMPGVLKTRVRYDMVGSAADFYREQRVGEWDLGVRLGTMNIVSESGWHSTKQGVAPSLPSMPR